MGRVKKTDNFPVRSEQLMTELKTTGMTNKGSLMKFWSKQASSASLGKSNPPVLQIPVANDKSLINKESVKEDDALPSSAVGKLGGVVSKRPAQHSCS